MIDRTLYTEVCAYMRERMRLSGRDAQPLRRAEACMIGVLIVDASSGVSDSARRRAAVSFASRYIEEANAR